MKWSKFVPAANIIMLEAASIHSNSFSCIMLALIRLCRCAAPCAPECISKLAASTLALPTLTASGLRCPTLIVPHLGRPYTPLRYTKLIRICLQRSGTIPQNKSHLPQTKRNTLSRPAKAVELTKTTRQIDKHHLSMAVRTRQKYQ